MKWPFPRRSRRLQNKFARQPLRHRLVLEALEERFVLSSGSFFITPPELPPTAGAPQIFTVEVFDAQGALDSTYLGTVHFTSTDPQAKLPADYTFLRNDAGVHTFTLTLVTAGAQAITVTDVKDSTMTGTRSMTVLPGPMSGFAVPGLASALAGVATTTNVEAVDSFGNVVTNYGGTAHFSSSDPGATLPGDYTFTAADAGIHAFNLTFRTAGSQALTATDSASPSLTGTQNVLVNPGPAAMLAGLGGSGGITTAGVGGSGPITALDAFGNVATGYLGTVHFSSSDPQAVLPADYTFTAADAGTHTFSAILKTAGLQSLTAQDTAIPTLISSQTGITVLPAAASQFQIDAPAQLTEAQAADLSVAVLDPFGNLVPTFSGTLRFSSNDPDAILPSDYTFGAGDQGAHTFANGVILYRKGMPSITATDTSSPSLKGRARILVENVDPEVTIADTEIVPLGVPFLDGGEFSDPGKETWTATVDYGDDSGELPLLLNADKTFILNHVYSQEGSYLLRVSVHDSNGGDGSDTALVNVLPSLAVEESTQGAAPGLTAAVTVTNATGTLQHSSNAQSAATLLIAQLQPAFIFNLPSSPTEVLEQFDIRVVNSDPGDVATFTFRYAASVTSVPVLQYIDPLTHRVLPVQGSQRFRDSLIIDPVRHVITLTLDNTSAPAITNLKGTVFTVVIAKLDDAATTVAPLVAMAQAGSTASNTDAPPSFVQTTAFQRTSQLTLALSPSQGVNAASESSGTTEEAGKDGESSAWLRALLDVLRKDPQLFLILPPGYVLPLWMQLRDWGHAPAQTLPDSAHQTLGQQSRMDLHDAFFAGTCAWDSPGEGAILAEPELAQPCSPTAPVEGPTDLDASWAIAAVMAGFLTSVPSRKRMAEKLQRIA
jgi:hypothetical protein